MVTFTKEISKMETGKVKEPILGLTKVTTKENGLMIR